MDARMVTKSTRSFTSWLAVLAFVWTVAALAAPVAASDDDVGPPYSPSYYVPTGSEITILPDGSETVIETFDSWKLICSSQALGVTDAELKEWADAHYQAMAGGHIEIIDNSPGARGFNIVFQTDGSVPSEAVTALGLVEAYLESLFGDSVTITISISFQNMGNPNVIGSTAPAYVNNVSYTTTRTQLTSGYGMDSDDIIQSYLPSGSTCPVRFDGSTGTVTNHGNVEFTKANYKAVGLSVTGNAASMIFNTQFTFDYDPSNGVSAMSFVDVAVHETGHAMGFVSGADGFTGVDFNSLDLFRFQRTDGGGDYNPDTLAEFQTTARLVDYNNPDDDANTDLISVEYRMSDGNPWQASHFREQTPSIGQMDPATSSGETRYPNYFAQSDKDTFDAIGWDYPPCIVPQFTQQPAASQNVCPGVTVQFTVAVNIPNPGFQWRISSTPLVDDGVHVFGATTATLTLVNVTSADSNGFYNCLVTNLSDGCLAQSNYASLYVYPAVAITSHPQNKTIIESDDADFHVTASGSPPLTYRWRYNGADLSNGGNIYGATTANLFIAGASADQAGWYDCRVTDVCGVVISNAGHLVVNTGAGAGRGDLNCDGVVDFDDINPFVLALSVGETEYYNQYPSCHFYNADVDSNGTVDFADINPFVDCLSAGSCP